MPPRPVRNRATPKAHHELAPLLDEFSMLDKKIKALSTRRDELKADMKGVLEQTGELDDKGNRWIEIDEDRKLKLEKRSFRQLDEAAARLYLADYENADGINLETLCIETIEVFSEDNLLALNYEGLVPNDALAGMYTETDNYAFKVITS